MSHNRTLQLAVTTALIAALGMTGCKKKEAPVVVETAPPAATTPEPVPPPAPVPAANPATAPVSVASVDMGSAVGADNKVTAPTAVFGPKDSIFTSIVTEGVSNNNKLSARLTYQDGKVVKTFDETVLNGTGSNTTEYHIANNKGWPVGNYKVEVLLDGNVVQTREISVK